MYLKISHIGIAVANLDESVRIWAEGLGLSLSSVEAVAEQKARVGFFPVGESSIELVEPTDPQSVVGRFLEKKGPGIHHLCLEVDNLPAAMADMKVRGITFTSEAPTVGAHQALVAFIHPRSTGGVLVELRQEQHHP